MSDFIEEIDKIGQIGSSLLRLAEEQIGIRQVKENIWLEDFEQYLGKYDAQTESSLTKSGNSKAFVNGTRSKTSAAESRLSDMLFPTDDKNWGIMPTPVPEIQGMTGNTALLENQAGGPVLDENQNEMTYADHADILMQEARDRAELMETEINDQLTEANYQDVCREAIHDACLYGTGVIKAPIVMNRVRKKWDKLEADVHTLTVENDYRPGVERVKIWDFFPDMSATDINECIFTFERKFISKKQLIELASRPGYMKDQISRVLKEHPTETNASGSSYIAKLRELSNLSVDINKGKYELWEYNGPLDSEDLEACGCEVDEREEREVVVSFIGSYIIKADLNPMETGDNPYSMFIYEKDDSSIFGYGVPRLVKNEQRIMNAAWRMIIDNAGLSTGPQIIQNREVITPSDGTWDLKPRKTWWVNAPDIDVRSAMATFEIPSHQAELTAIYEMSKQMMDDVTNLPLLAQGEMGGAPDTASGMSMLMNSSNVVLRRVVKSFDDNITVPVITRFYDWNMQNSDKEEIKGDYNVNARGSSTLLVKETQQQALTGLLQIASNPMYAPITKHAELYRKAVQSQHLVADDIVKTDDEIKAEKRKPLSPPPEIMLAKAEKELKKYIEELKADTAIQVAEINSRDSAHKTNTGAQIVKLQEDNKANIYMAEEALKRSEGSGI